MKSYDILGYAYDGALYCSECLPCETDSDLCSPYCASDVEDWTSVEQCDACGGDLFEADIPTCDQCGEETRTLYQRGVDHLCVRCYDPEPPSVDGD